MIQKEKWRMNLEMDTIFIPSMLIFLQNYPPPPMRIVNISKILGFLG